MTPDSSTVMEGSPVRFLIKATNYGIDDARGTSLSATLPHAPGSGLVWTINTAATTASGCSISEGTLTCAHGDLPAGAEVHVQVTSSNTVVPRDPLVNPPPLQVSVTASATADNVPQSCKPCPASSRPECGTCTASATVTVMPSGNSTNITSPTVRPRLSAAWQQGFCSCSCWLLRAPVPVMRASACHSLQLH